jgi:hypothetical protein
MQYMPILWIVWAGLMIILLILLLYRGTLTRYEEDQLFLDGSSESHHHEHDVLLAKVAKVRPLVKTFTGAMCILSAAILGIYVWNAIRQFYM